MMLYNKKLDLNKIACFADIFFNLINFEKSFDKNFFTFLLLKFNPSDLSFTYYNDSKNLCFNLRANAEVFHIGNFFISKDKYLIKFGNYTANPYILNEVLNYHIESYHNRLHEKGQLDHILKLDLPFFGETKVRSASSLHTSNGISIVMWLLKINQTPILIDVFRPLLSNKIYLNTLSDIQLDTISYCYDLVTDSSINFNDDNFDKYLSVIEMIEV